jgi:F0F1-type ATP synthase assembly protein I
LSSQFVPKKYRGYLGLGAEIAASLLLPMLAGYYADRYYDISPWGILTGVLLGLFFFVLTILRISEKLSNNSK